MSTLESTTVPGPGVAVTTGRRRTLALVIVALAFVMDLLDNTIVNIAIPSIQRDLGATYSAIQWLSAGYALAFAVLLITGGRLGDVVGYKRLFLVGVVGFTLASLLSGLAWSTEILIAARLLQGVTAALMAPQVISLMQVMYKPNERAAVMGLFGALGGLAASLGPIIGGLLIEWNIAGLDWRPIFLMNVPIGVFAVLAGIRYLPEGRSPHPLRLDVLGTVLVVVALGLLVFPLIQGRELDWPAWAFGMMAASLPLFAVFWLWQLRKQRRDGSPLVIPALFRIHSFRVGLLVNIVFQMLLLAFFLTFTLVLQIGLGYDVLPAALTGIPTAVGISVSIGVLAPKIVPRLGRYTLTVGAALMAVGLAAVLWVLAAVREDTNGWELAPGLLVVGLGMGLVMGLFFSVTLKDVDPAHAGSASGTMSALSQVGGAIGIALVGVIFFGGVTAGAGPAFDGVAKEVRTQLVGAGVPAAAAGDVVRDVRACYVDRASAKDGSVVPASCRALQQASGAGGASGALAAPIRKATADDFIGAFTAATVYSLALLVVAVLLGLLLPRRIEFEMPAPA
jgi:EmrB/QacA subfamily drug resistance transporter